VQETGQLDMQKVMESVLQWLSLPKNWKWLIIINNVDREFKGPAKDEQEFDLEEAMPNADHGSILVMSRLWSVKGTGKDLHLEQVNDDEAEKILVYHAGRPLEGWLLLSAPTVR
jgi:hypothetical protein